MSAPTSPVLLHVGLSSWIVQDGNLEDFEVEREYRFALGFWPQDDLHRIERSEATSLVQLAGALYEGVGTILHRTDDVWVIDFGVPAYHETSPPVWVLPGDKVGGTVYLGVDPFAYVGRLKSRAGMPDLFRRWWIRRILLETTPWKQSTPARGRTMLERDKSRESFREITRTDARRDDGGSAEYVLECELRGD